MLHCGNPGENIKLDTEMFDLIHSITIETSLPRGSMAVIWTAKEKIGHFYPINGQYELFHNAGFPSFMLKDPSVPTIVLLSIFPPTPTPIYVRVEYSNLSPSHKQQLMSGFPLYNYVFKNPYNEEFSVHKTQYGIRLERI